MDNDMRRLLAANRANWNARATVHRDSAFYNIDAYITDADAISDTVAWDRERLGNVTGLDLLHLQCHIGTDSISWARLGAEVVGLDFSFESIRIARKLSHAARAPVKFVCADVHAADRVLVPRFDIVYATAGVLCWIPDFGPWARAAVSCLRPGGRLYLRDGHPIKDTLDYSRTDDLLVATADYFSRDPDFDETAYTYTGDGVRVESPINYQWIHPLSTVVTTLAELGLRIDRLDETDWIGWRAFPWLVRADHGHDRWTFPPGHARVPLAYSIIATKT